MGQNGLLGIDHAATEAAGHGVESLGPSDSSDSGSDVAGLDTTLDRTRSERDRHGAERLGSQEGSRDRALDREDGSGDRHPIHHGGSFLVTRLLRSHVELAHEPGADRGQVKRRQRADDAAREGVPTPHVRPLMGEHRGPLVAVERRQQAA